MTKKEIIYISIALFGMGLFVHGIMVNLETALKIKVDTTFYFIAGFVLFIAGAVKYDPKK
jgi:uncharacterized membrane protein